MAASAKLDQRYRIAARRFQSVPDPYAPLEGRALAANAGRAVVTPRRGGRWPSRIQAPEERGTSACGCLIRR